MMALLKSALTGWTDYTQHGKFAALLLLSLVYLGFVLWGGDFRKTDTVGEGKNHRLLYLYATLTTLGCICPVTALILLKYQTAFYSYVWIWAIVPQTALIAWAAADFVGRLLKEKSLRNGMAAVLLLLILFLSGNPVSEWAQAQTTQIPALISESGVQEPSAWETLELLSMYNDMEGDGRDFSLWAPKEIMAAARAYSAEIRPVYGRSIWDASLGSYSYDTYATWQEDLYLWMSHLETTGETEYFRAEETDNDNTATSGKADRTIDFASCLKQAEEIGLDYLLLPGNLSEESLHELQKTADGKLQSFGDYYLLQL